MTEIEKTLKNMALAGIGAAATVAEKGEALLNEFVKKGESTVDQGKVVNEELKRNLKEKVSAAQEKTEEHILGMVDRMSDAEIERLKAHIRVVEEKRAKKPESDASGETAK